MGNLNFDSAATEPISMSYEPLEPGWYTFRIQETEIKEAKSGAGRYLKITFKEKESGRSHWENYNLWNSNEKAQQIGRGQFSSVCRACGKIGMVRDSSELHGKELEIKLKVVPAKDGYEARNAATDYRAIESNLVRAASEDSEDNIPF